LRILSSSEFFYVFHGGWEISQFTLLRHLAKEHDVHAVFWGPKNIDFELDNIKVHQRKFPFKQYLKQRLPRTFPDLQTIYENLMWKNVLEKEIKRINPDIILTELRYAPATVEKALICDIPAILFMRSYEHFCPIGFGRGFDHCANLCRGRCWKCVAFDEMRLIPPFTKKMLALHRKVIQKANLVLSNSFFMKKVVKLFCRVDSEVVYPFIDFDKYIAKKREHRYISFVSPAPHKGGEIFVEIARALPEYDFFVCGGGSRKIIEQFRGFRNLRYIPWIDDMRDVYSQTWLMLVPSIWPEPFGRVVVEAMANGIPCIVSRRGGLPEAIGDAGIMIEDIFDVDNWVSAIRRMERADEYRAFSERARLQAQKFEFRNIFKEFKSLISFALGIQL
jgi:glycosyltransferase involved in cell wall biosynthesis